MPELPDVTVYLEALEARILGRVLQEIHAFSPFVVRSYDPPIRALVGLKVVGLRRMGKRLVFAFEGDLFLVLHLMIAGRLLWKESGPKSGGKVMLASLVFENGALLLTEAGSKKRASLHVVRGEEALAAHDPGGLEVLDASLDEFRQRLTAENRTLKRALTQPKTFSGIGNAYSDEILHAARLSPLRLTRSLADEEVERLFNATRGTLTRWTQRLRQEFGGAFPGQGQVTAFRPDFAAHGKYGQPCPVCGVKIQRIAYAENETNYCPRCQNEDRILADRSLSRLLKEDWPRTVEEMNG